MRYARFGNMLLALAVAAAPSLWAQRGGRGAAAATAAQTPAATTTPVPAPSPAPAAIPQAAAGRGGGLTGGGASDEFYNFNPAAAQSRPDPNVDQPPVETHQKITAGGQTLAYTTHAGFLPLPNATTGAPEAHIFFTAYTKEGVSDPAVRPLLMFFGGAPGVSAAWQEFGGFGPKRMKAEGGWADNPDTMLAQADLVFVNPGGTGYSFPVQPARGSLFWNTTGDIASLAEFVRVFLDRQGRIVSPLYLVGEDAVTGRVAGLAAYLIDHTIPVKGLVLLSMIPAADAAAGDTQFLTLMPSLAISSWYHKKLSPELNALTAEQVLGQARQFASREYLHALYKGDRMTNEERTKAIADMARLTGLSKQFIVNNDLRVTVERYNAELMRDDHMGLSRSDARVTGYMGMGGGGGRGGGGGFGRGGGAAVDFAMAKINGPFATSYTEYLKKELAFTPRRDGIFYLSSGGVTGFTPTGADDTSLSAAFLRNPDLKLFVGVDLFDLSTPFYATEYTLAHLDVSPQVRARNIVVSHQEAGAMAYLDAKALAKMSRELGAFVSSK